MKVTLLEKIDTITFKKSVIIHDEKNYLYPTFDNKEIALQNIKIEAEHNLTDLAEKYNLADLADDNWELYLNAVQNYNSSEYNDERGLLECYFDIYDNDDDNLAILSCLENASSID